MKGIRPRHPIRGAFTRFEAATSRDAQAIPAVSSTAKHVRRHGAPLASPRAIASQPVPRIKSILPTHPQQIKLGMEPSERRAIGIANSNPIIETRNTSPARGPSTASHRAAPLRPKNPGNHPHFGNPPSACPSPSSVASAPVLPHSTAARRFPDRFAPTPPSSPKPRYQIRALTGRLI